MTLRERVIVETYTGICMTSAEERGEVYKYMQRIMGRPVYTHMLADVEMQRELREKAGPDFIALCKSNPADVFIRELETRRDNYENSLHYEAAAAMCICINLAKNHLITGV